MKTKTLLVAAGAALIIASPAFARTASHVNRGPAFDAFAAGPEFIVPGGQTVYGPTGEYLGRDPDANVRLQLRLDGEWWNGGD